MSSLRACARACVRVFAGARAVVGSAMDALRELFLSVLLPDRKLRWACAAPCTTHAVRASWVKKRGKSACVWQLIRAGLAA